jgi:aryl-alcohol dehydrogenase-like predicted oxidoreductase
MPAAIIRACKETTTRRIFTSAQELETIARAKACTPAQVALAWLLSRGDYIVPIPGTKRRSYLEENVKALAVHLSLDEVGRIEKAFPPGAAVGDRYPEYAMRHLNG